MYNNYIKLYKTIKRGIFMDNFNEIDIDDIEFDDKIIDYCDILIYLNEKAAQQRGKLIKKDLKWFRKLMQWYEVEKRLIEEDEEENEREERDE
jgi:hypothetical protein